jgi:hypothetical protein
MLVRRRSLTFGASFLVVLLSLPCLQTATKKPQTHSTNEEFYRDFPDATLLRPTDPPQSFNFDTGKWSDWPPEKLPVVLPVVMPDTRVLLKRLKRR